MSKRRLAGLVWCSALVAPVYGHDPSASPTPTPAVYQNAIANTYSGSSPNSYLQPPTGNPSPTKGILPKALSGSVPPSSSSALLKPLPSPSPKLAKATASPSPNVLKAPTSLPKFVKAVASPSPNVDEIVGPPAPKLTKIVATPAPNLVNAVASPQPKLQKLKADAAPSPEIVKAVTSPAAVKPLTNPPATKSPPTAAPSPSAISLPAPTPEPEVGLVVSVRDQKLAVVVNGKIFRTYKISTSRYGEGDNYGSWQTPLGHLQVATKIGAAAPAGAVFHRRQPTGEVLAANAPGRDPIISRIIWLRGTEEENKRAFQRCIYIHGTPQEGFLGRKASYGCIRMRSSDVIEVFNWVGIGTNVAIVEEPIRRAVKEVRAEAMIARNEQKRVPEPGGNPSEANR
jgi:lipoprotein-anchoring transpeptidase ErfK/SrfK